MIELHITMTGRGCGSKEEDYRCFAEDNHSFADMTAAKAWLRSNYGKSKRAPMYRDTKDGRVIRVGYIFHFNNADWSHSPVHKWRQQDWVEFRECKTLELR